MDFSWWTKLLDVQNEPASFEIKRDVDVARIFYTIFTRLFYCFSLQEYLSNLWDTWSLVYHFRDISLNDEMFLWTFMMDYGRGWHISSVLCEWSHVFVWCIVKSFSRLKYYLVGNERAKRVLPKKVYEIFKSVFANCLSLKH